MLNNFKNIYIRNLNVDNAKDLYEILIKEKSGYLKYFTPFNFDEETISKVLKKTKFDKYFGIYINGNLVGFYMLRGFDDGYEIPSYGVFISKKYSGLRLSKLTLQHAISLCRLNNIGKLMLKVHPNNIIAKNIYESFGFKKISIDKKNKNIIYIKDLV